MCMCLCACTLCTMCGEMYEGMWVQLYIVKYESKNTLINYTSNVTAYRPPCLLKNVTSVIFRCVVLYGWQSAVNELCWRDLSCTLYCQIWMLLSFCTPSMPTSNQVSEQKPASEAEAVSEPYRCARVAIYLFLLIGVIAHLRLKWC